jgi:hypothetical protein
VGSRDPAREILPLDCDSRAGFSLANAPAEKVYPAYLELPHFRGRYFRATPVKPKGGNVETRFDRCRSRGLFDFNRLGGGGECTGQYQPERLPG